MRKPGVLAQFQLTDALGDTASNERYMQMCLPLIYVGDIDGQPVYPPKNKVQVEALIQQLDEDGLSAVMMWYIEHIVQPTVAAVEDAQQRASLKN